MKTFQKEGLLASSHRVFVHHICFQTLLLVPSTLSSNFDQSVPSPMNSGRLQKRSNIADHRSITRRYGDRRITTPHARSTRELRGKLEWTLTDE